MSWSSDEILEGIVDILKDELEDEQKERVYLKLVKLFDSTVGADLLAETTSIDPIFDEIVQKYYEGYDEDEEDCDEDYDDID